MFLLRLSTQIIVHESCDEELELSNDLIDGALIGALLDLVLEDIIHFDHLLICECQIILASVAA